MILQLNRRETPFRKEMVRNGRGVCSYLRNVSTSEEEEESASSTSSTWSSSMSSSRICSTCLRSLSRIQYGSDISPPQAPLPQARRGLLWKGWRVGDKCASHLRSARRHGVWALRERGIVIAITRNLISKSTKIKCLICKLYSVFLKKKFVIWKLLEQSLALCILHNPELLSEIWIQVCLELVARVVKKEVVDVQGRW
jgi:hypothetical protein